MCRLYQFLVLISAVKMTIFLKRRLLKQYRPIYYPLITNKVNI